MSLHFNAEMSQKFGDKVPLLFNEQRYKGLMPLKMGAKKKKRKGSPFSHDQQTCDV